MDIPKDVTVNKAEFCPVTVERKVRRSEDITEEALDQAAELIQKSKKPYIFVGGGAVISEASGELMEFVEKVQAPVTDSLMGKGAFDGNHKLYTAFLANFLAFPITRSLNLTPTAIKRSHSLTP